jgi:hypothetical protein
MMNFCFNCESQKIELDTDEAKAVCADCQSEWSVYESDNEEISKVVNSEMKCPKCQHKALPKPVLMCTDCDNPDPYDIFDCQIKIKMVGSKDGRSKDLVIDDIRIQEPDERLFDKKFQGDDPEWNQKIADGMKNPLDLNRQLAHLTQDEEASLLGVANPFTAQESRGFKQYRKDLPTQKSRPTISTTKAPRRKRSCVSPPRALPLRRVAEGSLASASRG